MVGKLMSTRYFQIFFEGAGAATARREGEGLYIDGPSFRSGSTPASGHTRKLFRKKNAFFSAQRGVRQGHWTGRTHCVFAPQHKESTA